MTTGELAPAAQRSEEVGTSEQACGLVRQSAVQAPEAAVDSHTSNHSQAFPRFPDLAAELRLQIWNAAIELQMNEPRVVNIFVKCHNPKRYFGPPSRLTVINTEFLRTMDGRNLLGANYDSRNITETYFAAHPDDAAHRALRWRPARHERFMGLYRLSRHCLRLRVDPYRDVLFLNGLDLDPIPPAEKDQAPTRRFRDPNLNNPLHLPPNLHGMDFRDPSPEHTRGLIKEECYFTRCFGSVIMPVQGLIERLEDADARRVTFAIFHSPMYDPGYWWMRSQPLPKDKTFIALVGHYRWRNLQLCDLEFISEGEVSRVRKEAWKEYVGWTASGKRTAKSILHRDVLVMSAVWKKWGYADRENAPRLRFARVREEALRGLRAEDVYLGDGKCEEEAKEKGEEGGGEKKGGKGGVEGEDGLALFESLLSMH